MAFPHQATARRRIARPSNANPPASNATLAGSGTGAGLPPLLPVPPELLGGVSVPGV